MLPSSKKAGDPILIALQAGAVIPCLVTLVLAGDNFAVFPVLFIALPALLVLAIFSRMRAQLLILNAVLVVGWSIFSAIMNMDLLDIDSLVEIYLLFMSLVVLPPVVISLAVAVLCLKHLRQVRRGV